MTWNDIAGVYVGIGLILALFSWFRVHMMGLRDQCLCVLAVTFLWLPLILAGVVLFCWLAFGHPHRARQRKAEARRAPEWKKRRWLNALKDKHNIDDEAVTARVMSDLKVKNDDAD